MNKNSSTRTGQTVQRAVALVISITILLALYSKTDLNRLKEVFRKFDFFYLAIILLLFVVIVLLVAWRWLIMSQPYCSLSYFESLKLVSSSSSLNVVLPSKIGSFAKAYFMTTNGCAEAKPAISMVIYEKMSDLAVMSFFFVIASALNYEIDLLIILTSVLSLFLLLCYLSLHITHVSSGNFLGHLRKYKIVNKFISLTGILRAFNKNPNVSKSRLLKVNLVALILWIVHIGQITLFFNVLELHVPLLKIVTYMLCATFVGLLPISIAGLGTRDLTIVHLFKGLITYNEAISIGILCASRYIIPTLIGLPFLVHLAFSRGKREISKC